MKICQFSFSLSKNYTAEPVIYNQSIRAFSSLSSQLLTVLKKECGYCLYHQHYCFPWSLVFTHYSSRKKYELSIWFNLLFKLSRVVRGRGAGAGCYWPKSPKTALLWVSNLNAQVQKLTLCNTLLFCPVRGFCGSVPSALNAIGKSFRQSPMQWTSFTWIISV